MSPSPETASDQQTFDPPPIALRLQTHRLLTLVAVLAMVVGVGSVLVGAAGAVYTWQQASAQGVTTPADARVGGVAVRGPVSMLAQADLITQRQLDRADGRYPFQIERMVPVVDKSGDPVLSEDGQPVLVTSQLAQEWADATAMTTALQLGVIAYVLSAFAIVVGLVLAGTGHALYRLRFAEVTVH